MGSDNDTEHDEAGELHAVIVRRKARELRSDLRRMAQIYDRRNWADSRICDALDVDLDTLTRLLALDGRLRCTECAFGLHPHCDLIYSDGRDMTPCECFCRR
ncbi:hypothetical protein ACIQLJ_08475 [Microbacterium sp. NPDC091313]